MGAGGAGSCWWPWRAQWCLEDMSEWVRGPGLSLQDEGPEHWPVCWPHNWGRPPRALAFSADIRATADPGRVDPESHS